MSTLKKILLYNSPGNVARRYRSYNFKQKWCLIDGFILLFIAIYFYKSQDMYLMIFLLVLSISSFVGIYLCRDK